MSDKVNLRNLIRVEIYSKTKLSCKRQFAVELLAVDLIFLAMLLSPPLRSACGWKMNFSQHIVDIQDCWICQVGFRI